MTRIKFILTLLGTMALCYTIGYAVGSHDTNTKWQIEQSKRWRPVIG